MTRRRVVPSPDERPIENLIDDYTSRRIDRRGFLRRAFASACLPALPGAFSPRAGAMRSRRRPRRHRLPRARLRPRRRRPKSPPRRLPRRSRPQPRKAAPSVQDQERHPHPRPGIRPGLERRRPPPGSTRDCCVQARDVGARQPARRDVRAVCRRAAVHVQAEGGHPFHKGYGEVTAEDVKFSFERVAGLTKPNIESPYWVTGWRSRRSGSTASTRARSSSKSNSPR